MKDNNQKFSIRKFLSKHIFVKQTEEEKKLTPKEFFFNAVFLLMFLNCLAVLNMINPPKDSLLLNCFYIMVAISVFILFINPITPKYDNKKNELSKGALLIIGITLILGTFLFFIHYDAIISNPHIFGNFNKVRS